MIKSFAGSRMITRCRNKEAVLANLMCYSPLCRSGQQAAGPLPLAQEHFQASLVNPGSVLVQTPPSLCVISVHTLPELLIPTHVLGRVQTETLSSLTLTAFQVVY